MSNGKGDKRRPMAVDEKTLDNNWRMAFAKDTPMQHSNPVIINVNPWLVITTENQS